MSFTIDKVSDKMGQLEQELKSNYHTVSKTSAESPLPAVPIKIVEDEEDLDTIFADSEI